VSDDLAGLAQAWAEAYAALKQETDQIVADTGANRRTTAERIAEWSELRRAEEEAAAAFHRAL
jgi:hypothetical protein